MRAENVLITSAAAKVLLVQAFRNALDNRGQVFTADIVSDCAAAHFADRHFTLPLFTSERGVEALLTLCREADIGLVVPTRDGELDRLAEHRDAFRAQGTSVLVPPVETVRRCLNKRAFGHFLESHGLPPVPEFDEQDIHFPAFARPVSGSGGVGARKLTGPQELEALGERDRYLLHPYIEAPEYSIDLLMDLDGRRSVQAVCRQRLRVVAGESKISRVVDHPVLVDLACRVGEALGLVGHNTVQAFDDETRGLLIIEVNPRFGGASNLSIQAGLDSPRRILGMLRGDAEVLAPRPVSIGATMLRYAQDVIAWPQQVPY